MNIMQVVVGTRECHRGDETEAAVDLCVQFPRMIRFVDVGGLGVTIASMTTMAREIVSMPGEGIDVEVKGMNNFRTMEVTVPDEGIDAAVIETNSHRMMEVTVGIDAAVIETSNRQTMQVMVGFSMTRASLLEDKVVRTCGT